MSLQIEVITKKAEKPTNQTGVNLTLTLTCWPEGVEKEYPMTSQDGLVDMKNACIHKDFTRYVKGQVEGLSQDDLICRATDEIKNEMRAEVEKYIAEQAIMESQVLESERVKIETELISLTEVK